MKILTGCNSKQAKGNPIYQYLAMITGSFNVISSGMHFGWPSPSLPLLSQEDSPLKITSDEGSWLAVMPLLGAIVGGILCSCIVNNFGRKRMIFVQSIPYIIGWLMVAFAPNSIVLILARLLAGIADGCLFSVIPMYLGEISEARIRGFLASSLSVTFVLGSLLINIIGSYTSVKNAALISVTFPTISLVTFYFMPESPYHYIMKGDIEAAKKSLRKLRGLEDVDVEIKRLIDGVKEANVQTAKFHHLFTVRSNRKAVIIMMILRTFQQLGGSSAITFYAGTIFREAGDYVNPEMATILYFAVQFLMGCVTAMIVDFTGRKPLVMFSITGSCVTLLIEGIYFYLHNNTKVDTTAISWLPLAALILYVIIFSIGLQTMPLLVLGELFSPSIKAYALAYMDVYFSVIATVISKCFQYSKDEFGIHVPFFVFSGCCAVGVVFIKFTFTETKGKTLEEIQQNFKKQPGENNGSSC